MTAGNAAQLFPLDFTLCSNSVTVNLFWNRFEILSKRVSFVVEVLSPPHTQDIEDVVSWEN